MSRSLPWKGRPPLPAAAWAVFRKDLLSELRTRYALHALVVFAVATLLLIAWCVITTGAGLTQEFTPAGWVTRQTEVRARLLAGLLWILLFFAGMSGLARVFVKEEEARTAPALRLAADPLAVFFGKMLFNVVLQLTMALLVTPLFVLLLHPQVAHAGLFVAEVVVGSVVLAAVTTILAAIVARAENRASLFAVLAFPIVLPVLTVVVNGTAAALQGGPEVAVARNQLVGLVSYGVTLGVVSSWLFEQVWSE